MIQIVIENEHVGLSKNIAFCMRERGVKIACGKVPAAEQHRTPQPKMK